MKYTLPVFFLLCMLWSCGNRQADSVDLGPVQRVAVAKGTFYRWLPDESTIQWRATHAGGLSPRSGNLRLLGGFATVMEMEVTAGVLEIDMASLLVDPESVPETDKKALDLQNLLKSESFFDVINFPSATFVLTDITPFNPETEESLLPNTNYTLSGNFSLKGLSHNLSFPAAIQVQDSLLQVNAHFKVDRSSWSLRFGDEGNPADLGVSQDVEVNIKLYGLIEQKQP